MEFEIDKLANRIVYSPEENELLDFIQDKNIQTFKFKDEFEFLKCTYTLVGLKSSNLLIFKEGKANTKKAVRKTFVIPYNDFNKMMNEKKITKKGSLTNGNGI